MTMTPRQPASNPASLALRGQKADCVALGRGEALPPTGKASRALLFVPRRGGKRKTHSGESGKI